MYKTARARRLAGLAEAWMRRLRSIVTNVLIAALVAAVGLPAPAFGAGVPLGTARGVRSAEMSLDGGKSWLSLRDRSLPAMAGARVRSVAGVVTFDLADGSRLALLPFGAARIEEPARVTIDYGRAVFRLAAGSRVLLATSSARLEPANPRVAASGEVVAHPAGTTALKMTDGSLLLREKQGPARVATAGREPLFVPEPPAASKAIFAAVAPLPDAGARAVFTVQGENVGYVTAEDRLVVRYGYAQDLTRPFPAATVEKAVANVPAAARDDDVVLLDLQGRYVGYAAGPAFVPAAGMTAAPPGTSGSEDMREDQWPWHYTLGLLGIVGGVVYVVTKDKPASPLGP